MGKRCLGVLRKNNLFNSIELEKARAAYQKIIRPHEGQQGNAEIGDEDDEKREEKRSGHSLLRITNFFACCRYAIESNEAEEARRCSFECSGKTEGKESSGAGGVCELRINVNRIDLPITDVSVEEHSDDDIRNDSEIEDTENVVDAS